MQGTLLLGLATSRVAGLGCRGGAETWEGVCPSLPTPALDYPLLSPRLVVEAAGVIPVASGRSCQSGQAETPPRANVASQRAYATLTRASATWATLHHPQSLLQRLHPPGSCPPPACKGPRLGGRGQEGLKRPQWHRLSSVHHCRVFFSAGETYYVATGLGEGGKELARVACFEFTEVLRVSLGPLCTPWLPR